MGFNSAFKGLICKGVKMGRGGRVGSASP